VASRTSAGFLYDLFFDPEDGGDIFLPHGVISQKVELFITIGVRTTNPTV
jgi:hypothetical protein